MSSSAIKIPTTSPNGKFDDLGEDTLSAKVLCHYSLLEMDVFRQVSSTLHLACDRRKAYIRSLLVKSKMVEIVGLASVKGKAMNGRLGIIHGEVDASRYPVTIHHLTGETQRLSVKPQNLNPFISNDQESEELKRVKSVQYTTDGKVREGHGRFLDEVLMLNRFAVNELCGGSLYQGDYQSFKSLSRSDRRVAQMNAQVYTLYKVNPITAGYRSTNNLSILDKTVATLCENQDMFNKHLGKMAKYEQDGPDGKLIVRNMVRFARTWLEERISGNFWIYKIVPSGTLVVKIMDDLGHDYEMNQVGSKKLGKVYLVKGMGSKVGENLPIQSKPVQVCTTFLPMYGFLVYDGIMTCSNTTAAGGEKEEIRLHVEKAVRDQTVVYCGESAAQGLWDSEPPELPNVAGVKDEIQEELKGSESTEEKIQYKPTSPQVKMMKKIINFAKKIGFKTVDKTSFKPDECRIMIVRHLAFTKRDNPNQLCGISFTDNLTNMHMFRFEQWPTYTIDELLPEILKVVKESKVVPCMIWMDEKSLVKPLSSLLQIVSEQVGFKEKIDVEWYPPPSQEENHFHQTLGGM
eukprot:scaffold10285_cov258-Chaetoceros_neogracile.AAC.3